MTKILLINPLGVDVYDQMSEEIVAPAVSSDTEVVVRSLVGSGVPDTAFLAGGVVVHEPVVGCGGAGRA